MEIASQSSKYTFDESISHKSTINIINEHDVFTIDAE